MTQPLLMPFQREQHLANGGRTALGEEIESLPIVKLFMPDGPGTWLSSKLDPTEPTRAFGLCNTCLGSPELGYVDHTELAALRSRLRLPVGRDLHFRADRPLSAYTAKAQTTGRITV
nr:DUF2958 domain-containing protein [Methylobacterium sp. L1A1]